MAVRATPDRWTAGTEAPLSASALTVRVGAHLPQTSKKGSELKIPLINIDIPDDLEGYVQYHAELLKRRIRGVTDLPLKTNPEAFGGGRVVGLLMRGEESGFMCSRAGCGREAHASWGGCADQNIIRPLCAECDVLLNYLALIWWGDPQAQEKMRVYSSQVEGEIGRELEEDAWDITGLMERVQEQYAE